MTTGALRALIGALLAGSFLAAGAHAQDYPVKPIRFIIGPAPDVLARLIGQKLTEAWGQQVIVDQRPAAGGIIAGEAVAKAAPDGYTWLLSTGAYPTLVGLYPKLPFDFTRDLTPVSLLASIPFLLVVHPSVPAKSVAELVKLARERPGQLNYASGGNGTTSHLAGEMFKNMAGINIVHVPYKGTVPGVVDLMSGHVHTMFAIMQSAYPYVQAGRLKALAVSGARRSPSAPTLPTIAEAGVPGYEFTSWNGVHVTAGTPRAVIAKIHGELVKVVALPDVKERMFNLGMEVAGSTPEQLGSLVASDIAKWGKVIKTSGVRVE